VDSKARNKSVKCWIQSTTKEINLPKYMH